MPLWAGCDGCRPGLRDPQAASEEVPEADEFTFRGPKPLPLGGSPAQSGIKPGHWFTIGETITSNRDDQRGVLRHRVGGVPGGERDASVDSLVTGQALPPPERSLAWLPLVSERPALLPKQRTKRFDSRLLATSDPLAPPASRAFLMGQFATGSASSLVETGRAPVNRLGPEEYFFVVLTTRPEKFSILDSADWVRPRIDSDFSGPIDRRNYRLVFVRPDDWLPLPETMLDWTSTAVVLWDDVEPSELTPEQSRALIDWVHFGGRLLVNGPAMGIELTRESLGPLLPQQIVASEELEPEAVAELIRRWSVPADEARGLAGDDSTERQVQLAQRRESRLATAGPLASDAIAVVGTGDLVLQKRAGRGQVVLTRFDITSDWLVRWRSRDSFINAALLGRPPRQYSKAVTTEEYLGGPQWQLSYPSLGLAVMADASHNTGLRLLARDARLPVARDTEPTTEAAASGTQPNGGTAEADSPDAPPEFDAHPSQGIGGWRDDSDLAAVTLAALRAESGVTIPTRDFVLRGLAAYLFVLVPLNFVVFRLLGRVEWAWFAVPVIGLIGAAWIARGANLDIGFARSQTEIAVIEAHADYPRAHATRFVAIYNSLSRRYDFRFDSPDAAAAPIGILGQVPVDREESVEATLQFGYSEGPTLAGVGVASNRTRMFHIEQMIDLGGAVGLESDPEWLRNASRFDLTDAVLVAKDDSGQVRFAAAGTLAAGGRTRLRWSDGPLPAAASDSEAGATRLLGLLADPAPLPHGSMRLVARCEQDLPGMTVTPESAQTSHSAVFVAHLRYPATVPPVGDKNLPPEVPPEELSSAEPVDPLDPPDPPAPAEPPAPTERPAPAEAAPSTETAAPADPAPPADAAVPSDSAASDPPPNPATPPATP